MEARNLEAVAPSFIAAAVTEQIAISEIAA